MNFEITSTNPVVKAVIEGSAPRPAQLAASRAILPLPEIDLLEVLVTFSEGSDAELKERNIFAGFAHDPRSEPYRQLRSQVLKKMHIDIQ